MGKQTNNTSGTPGITTKFTNSTNSWAILGGNGVDIINAETWFAGKTASIWEIIAGNGADTVHGSSRDEIIWGDSKNNSDTSANGADTLNGGGGNDRIYGGNGGDLIAGDDGADLLWGDRGGDTFKYKLIGDSEADGAGAWSSTTGDWVKDFSKSEGDKLDLGALNAFLTGPGPIMLLWGAGPAAHGVWIGADGSNKIVYVDTNGDTVADVAIKVTGSIDGDGFIGVNHAPDISVVTTDSAAACRDEGDSGLTASGTLTVVDPDVPNVVDIAVSASDDAGHFTESELEAMFSLTDDDDLTANPGETHNLGWSFDSGSEAFDFLAVDEELVITYTLTASDGLGGTDTQDVTITIKGTNDAPAISVGTDDADSACLDETNAGLTASDTLTLTDPDTSDVVDTSVTGVTVSGTGPDGGLSEADFLGMFDLTGDDDNAANGTAGNLGWSFDSDLEAFDFLADGETLILTYHLSASDGNGGTDTHDVTITIKGSNDDAEFSGDDTGSITEDDDPNTVGGTLVVDDVDGDDTIQAETEMAGQYGKLSINAAGEWTYTLDNSNPDVDALNDDSDPLTDTFTVKSADGTQHDIVITINGNTDGPPAYDPPDVYEGSDDPNDHDGDAAANKVIPGPVNITDDPGSSTLYGSDLADSINAGNGNDAVYGYGGNDTIKGQGGADTSLFGQAGNDVLWGGQGSDTIYGGSGNDTIYGNMQPPESDVDNQPDFLLGGSGTDTIFGQSGADQITGGYGADILSGGAGDDNFIYLSNNDTGDTINGFVQGEDTIDLTEFALTGDFGGALAGPGQLAGNDVGYTWDGGNTIVYIDTDGNGSTDIELTLTGNIALVATDFIFA